MRRVCVIVWALFCVLSLAPVSAGAEPVTLTFEKPEAAGISGLRPHWNTPIVLGADGATEVVDKGRFGKAPSGVWSPAEREQGEPGALVFDAVHRSLLVRFPEAAPRIAAKLNDGYAIEKVELALPFEGTELWPRHYRTPAGLSFLNKKWASNPPEWHAIAYALRKPWAADPKHGPTYNAYIHGAGYWNKYGAQDEQHDRFPHRFGPTEVSHQHTTGRMDVTALLRDKSFGDTLAQRLHVLSHQGLLVRKWETYDASYWSGGYEWATATGPRGILIDTPRLIVTLTPTDEAPRPGALPDAPDVPTLAQKLRNNDAGGEPTAVMPTADQIEQYANTRGFRRPDWMPDWQWRHVKQLHALGGAWQYPDTPEAYAEWIDKMLGIAPRRWSGFRAVEQAQDYFLYSDTWPAPVRDHWKRYWRAWLMPDRTADELVQGYIGQEQAQAYYDKTGDWRGNFSVYRTYCYAMGTMNFNHWATAGTLFGGHIIDSDRLVRDGRHGLNRFLLRTWSWYDGSTQESVDHYYLAHSLTAQKMFADFGPQRIDRMMGDMILAKGVEELTSAFHPDLRRFIHPSTRTGLAYLFAKQEGLQHILHTISERGTLTDAERETIGNGIPVIGRNLHPGQVALQTLNGPWAPLWARHMLDNKPLPYEMTTAYKEWGSFKKNPLYRRSYQGAHYGLASQDVKVGTKTVPIMAQWRRTAEPVASATDLGTLTLRFGINRTNLLDTLHARYNDQGKRTGQNPNGLLGREGGFPVALQHRNKMLALTTPYKGVTYDTYTKDKSQDQVRSLQTTLGLFTLQEGAPSWRVYLNGRPVDTLPVTASAGDRIAIHDGVSYLGIIPLPSTDLGRKQEVRITDQTGEPVALQGGGEGKPALLIEQYLYQSDTPMPEKMKQSARVDNAYGGFVIEVGDKTEHGSFAAFQSHLAGADLTARWKEEAQQLDVRYTSAGDTLELGFKPGAKGQQTLAHRRVNGDWPYLPDGLDRDTTLTQQGRTQKLAKNGATLWTEPDRMAYLQTEPTTGTYAAFNPFPDPTLWHMTTPGDVRIEADGRVGLARMVVRPDDGKLSIDYAATRKQADRSDMASALIVRGMGEAPSIELNGEPAHTERITIENEPALLIPLRDQPRAPEAIEQRLQNLRGAYRTSNLPDFTRMKLLDMHWLGPFPGGNGAIERTLGPEAARDGVDLQAGYEGLDGQGVSWRRVRNWRAGLGGPRAIGGLGKQSRHATVSRPDERPITYFGLAQIHSDRSRRATLNVGLRGGQAVSRAWLNGERIDLGRDLGGSARITLNQGANELLLKVSQTKKGTRPQALHLTLGTAKFNLPLLRGVHYRTERGLMPVNPADTDQFDTKRHRHGGVYYSLPNP